MNSRLLLLAPCLALFSVAVGGTDQQNLALIGFVIADYVTGLLAA